MGALLDLNGWELVVSMQLGTVVNLRVPWENLTVGCDFLRCWLLNFGGGE